MTELATQGVARARAARIRDGIQTYLHTLADIAGAYAQRDWVALGYESWQGYVDGEYSEHRLRLSAEHRAKAVAELRLAGMSTRAIGSALGVSHTEVGRQLRSGGTDVPPEVQGADGKTYAATRPSPPTGTGATAPGAAPQPDQSGPEEVEPASEGGCGSTSSTDHPGQGEADARLATAATRSAAESEAPTAPTVAAGANFGEVLDRLVPDPNPHREWQRRFLDAISGVHKVMRFTPEDVVEKADDQCIEELIRVTDLLADHRLSVVNARLASLPINVTPIRRIS